MPQASSMPPGSKMNSLLASRSVVPRSSTSETPHPLPPLETLPSTTCATGLRDPMSGNQSASRLMAPSTTFQRESCSHSHAPPQTVSTLPSWAWTSMTKSPRPPSRSPLMSFSPSVKPLSISCDEAKQSKNSLLLTLRNMPRPTRERSEGTSGTLFLD